MTSRNQEAYCGEQQHQFPVICGTCLGDNPYVQMTKANYDKECKICTRPFTVFRWRPGRNARYKKTEICQTCTQLKNVCQVCLLDLDFGLPVQARDAVLCTTPPTTTAAPESGVNREYFMAEYDSHRSCNSDRWRHCGPNNAGEYEAILKLRRPAPYYKRNRPHVCSFYVRGEYKRGVECPYRHELPPQTGAGELSSHQNIKDRYFGVNDPVAMNLLNKTRFRNP